MPADYISTAAALSVSPRASSSSPVSGRRPDIASPITTSSPLQSPYAPPSPNPDLPWVRSRTPSQRAHRLSSARFGRDASSTSSPREHLALRTYRFADRMGRRALQMFWGLTPRQRGLAIIAVLLLAAMSILALVYSHALFAWLGPVAKSWRALPGGWLILWIMTFFTAFPPVIGYSTCVSVAGFVFGFPLGWPIVATANVAGSLAAFVASRTVLSGYVHRLVGKDHHFVALGQVLRRDGLLTLTMIRFCPLPYSLSNGFLATIPSISPLAFALSTALASPKLLVHVFIGSRLALLVEQGEKMSAGDKAVNYLSMAVGAAVGLGVSVLIYNRTMARARELALDADDSGDGAATANGRARSRGSYDDAEAGLLDPDAAAAAMMNDDDISLWDNDGYDDGYADEEEPTANGHKSTNGRLSP